AVQIPDNLMTAIVSLTLELQLQGHRADITILKAARAHAALMEKNAIDRSDILEVAPLAVLHRMKSSPLERAEDVREKVQDALDAVLGLKSDATGNSRKPAEMTLEEMAESMQVPGAMAAGSILFAFLDGKQSEAVHEPDKEIASADIDVHALLRKKGRTRQKSRTANPGTTGRYLRAERIQAGDRNYSIAVDATLRQAALRSARDAHRSADTIRVRRDDFRKKQRVKPFENLIVFVVDSSGSMSLGPRAPMQAAKGAVLAILRKARQSRSAVALIAFGGRSADLVLPPTVSIAAAESILERLPSGGATPFAESLLQACRLIRSERLKNPNLRPILVILSDGEANIPVSAGAEPLEELESLARQVSRDRIPAVFIDVTDQNKGETEMQRIAGMMQASYLATSDFSPSSILKAIHARE
ncbi:MAG: ChlI component of cobalt chelatase involved in biosynthesis, partial [Acidobacteria bacterium]|nr:ChlI component of cobalt chelatase involved in biosynthesis [Acidobacteriota bacterium]